MDAATKDETCLAFFAKTVNGWGFAFQVLSCIALRRVVCHQGDGAKKWHLQHLELALMWTWTFARKPVESDLYHKTCMFLACGCIWVKSTNWEVQCSKARRANIEFSRSPNRLLRPWPFGQAWRCCMAHLSQTKATLQGNSPKSFLTNESLPVNETLQLSSWTYGDAVFDKYEIVFINWYIHVFVKSAHPEVGPVPLLWIESSALCNITKAQWRSWQTLPKLSGNVGQEDLFPLQCSHSEWFVDVEIVAPVPTKMISFKSCLPVFVFTACFALPGSVSLQAAGLWALGRLAERLEAPGRGGMQERRGSHSVLVRKSGMLWES